MGCSVDDTLFKQNLSEWVYDERKLVTYQYVSVTLGVHVNLAKQMLHQFYSEEHTKETSKSNSKVLHALYHVSGLTKSVDSDNVVFTTTICRDDKLDSIKDKFSTLDSVHIYGIEASDVDGSDEDYGTLLKKLSAAFEEVSLLKGLDGTNTCVGPFKSIAPKPNSSSNVTLSGSPLPNVPASNGNSKASKDAIKENGKHVSPSTKTVTRKGKAVGTPWTNAAKVKSKVQETPNKVTSTKRQRSDSEEDHVEEIKQNPTTAKKKTSASSASAAFEGYKDVIDSESDSDNESSAPASPSPPPSPKKKRKRKTSQPDPPSPPPRNSETRRRRIRMLVDSSDSGEEDVKPPEVKTKEYFPVLRQDAPAQKKRKTKFITTHVMDEDGYLVTKREKVTDSESDGDEPTNVASKPESPAAKVDLQDEKCSPPSQPAKKSKKDSKTPDSSSSPPAKKTVSTKRTASKSSGSGSGPKTKQSTLTSFFVKKT